MATQESKRGRARTGLRYVGNLPVSFLRRRDITLLEKWVFALLRAHQGRNAWAWPAIQTLADEVGVTRKGVQLALAKLEGVGLVTIQRRPGSCNRYRVADLKGAN